MILKIFQSTNFELKFVDEDDCKYLGEVAVELPKSNDNVRVKVIMLIVENKLYLEAQVVSPHMKNRTDFDFQ
ncbi:hypothetical protein DPMN_116270 [Dreissena polymorpha]|uniref:Uncharacterized protein n=1 Tax=Dreissena polymorpha TaxID=45954 RepID=A0A9D4KNA5_DREPO|nr:hypothetical protein DPMN_116270 [Dreissena polymorpha]